LRLRAASRFVTAATFFGSPRRDWRHGLDGPRARDAGSGFSPMGGGCSPW